MKGVKRELREWFKGVAKKRRGGVRFWFRDAWPVPARDKHGGLSKREWMSLEEWRRRKGSDDED